MHGRRYFIDAQAEHPQAVDEALQQIATLYRIERTIRHQGLSGEQKHQYRLGHSQPIVDGFFDRCGAQLDQGGLVPSDGLAVTIQYMLKREDSLRVFLDGPAVPMDTNHLESPLRGQPAALGRGPSPQETPRCALKI